MTFTWSPAIKEPIESDVFAEKFYDYVKNWIVTGLAPSDSGSGILGVATGTCWVNGWRVEITVAETIDISAPDGDRWVYIELTKTGGKVTSIALADYGSAQTEDVRILIAKPNVDVGLITAVNDVRQYDPFEATLVRLKDDVGLDAWQHTSDLGKIDGAEIYDGSITNAKIVAAAGIPYSKLTLANTIVNADVNASAGITIGKLSINDAITNTHINTSAAIAWSKIAPDGNITYDNVAEAIASRWDFNGGLDLHGSNLRIYSGNDVYGIVFRNTTYPNMTMKAANDGTFTMTTYQAGDDINIKAHGDIRFLDPSNVSVDVYIKCSGAAGGMVPVANNTGSIGTDAQHWYTVVGQILKDADGSLGAYSERDDLGDLRLITELEDPDTGDKVRGSWGDPIWDASTIPSYIRSKSAYDAGTKRGLFNNAKWKGWVISLFKKLDTIDVTQADQLLTFFDELTTIKSRLATLEST